MKTRLERWTEKTEVKDGIKHIFLKPPRNCREKNQMTFKLKDPA